MSIFRKASELGNVPEAVQNAFFDNHEIKAEDEFEGLFKEASSNKSVYENRLKEFEKIQKKTHEFTAPQPAKYSELPGGIRRAGYGQRFPDESSEMFISDKIRNIQYDNNKYAESLLGNGFSIWEPEFDELQDAFTQSQKIDDSQFDRKSAVERQLGQRQSWEKSQMESIRKANVLPYRGMGITRVGNELPLDHGNFGSVDDFYADAHDQLREMTRLSNKERKSKISRQGSDPEESRAQWENKENIEARTLRSIENSSFLSGFADKIILDE